MVLFDLTQFAPTKHFRINELFSEFLVKLSGFLLTKKWFSLLKILHFFREPETPLDSGIPNRRRWLTLPASFGKNISKSDTVGWFCWQKTWRKFFKNYEFSFKNMVQIRRNSTILKGFQKVANNLVRNIIFSLKHKYMFLMFFENFGK